MSCLIAGNHFLSAIKTGFARSKTKIVAYGGDDGGGHLRWWIILGVGTLPKRNYIIFTYADNS